MIFGLSYFRIGAYVVIVIIMGYLVYQYRTGQEAKAQVEIITAERDKAIADHNNYLVIRAAQDKVTNQLSRDYENAITDLVDQLDVARNAHPTLRLCKPAMQAASSAPSATTRPDEASQNGSGGEIEQVLRTDQLYQIAGEAVECGQRLNHLQEWMRQQAAIN